MIKSEQTWHPLLADYSFGHMLMHAGVNYLTENDFVHLFCVFGINCRIWAIRAFSITTIYPSLLKITKPSTNLLFRQAKVTMTSFKPMLIVKGIFTHQKSIFKYFDCFEDYKSNVTKTIVIFKLTVGKS